MKIYMLLAVVTPLVYAVNPGATASLDIGVVDQAKDVYFNYIMNILKNVQIPDISFSGGYIHDNSFFVTEQAQNVMITNDPANNGVRLEVDALSAGFQSHSFRYKKSIIVAKGSVEASFTHVKLAATVGISQQTLSNGKVVPAFVIKNIDLDMPKDHISIKLKGNLVTKIASAFKSLFMGTIRDQITKAVKDNLYKQLPPVLNKLVADQKGYTEIYKGLDLDWSTRISRRSQTSCSSSASRACSSRMVRARSSRPCRLLLCLCTTTALRLSSRRSSRTTCSTRSLPLSSRCRICTCGPNLHRSRPARPSS